jgi:hypothetical protein
MGKDEELGDMLNYFRQMVHEDMKRYRQLSESDEGNSKLIPGFSYAGFFSGGWAAGVRVLSSIFPYLEEIELGQPDATGYEIWIEDRKTRARLSAIYDERNRLVRRSYSDHGDLKISEVRKNLKNWQSILPMGRPRLKAVELDITPEEVRERIENRPKLIETEDGLKLKNTRELALENLAREMASPGADIEEVERFYALFESWLEGDKGGEINEK